MKRKILLGIAALAVIAGGIFWYHEWQIAHAPSIIYNISVTKPNLVISANNLSAVEIWEIPTGTDVAEKDYVKLGDAILASHDEASQTWAFPIPAQPINATQILAKAFNPDHQEIGRASLPGIIGAAALNKALWGN